MMEQSSEPIFDYRVLVEQLGGVGPLKAMLGAKQSIN